MSTKKTVATTTTQAKNTKATPSSSTKTITSTDAKTSSASPKITKKVTVIKKPTTIPTSTTTASASMTTDKTDSNSGEESTLTVEERYTSRNLKQSIMSDPGMYIGSIILDSYMMWVYDEDADAIVYRMIQYVPGLYKIFDEILVNTRDQTIRDPTCKIIRIYLDKDTGNISCYNDGDNGIPVEMHKKEGVYVPEMIFGQLLTSSNYDKKGKITGGKHGYGAKLTNIFSDRFTVEVVDAKQKLKFSQTFSDNMNKREQPKITKANTKSYTQITFHPDYKKIFGIDGMTDDIYSLFQKRVYDIAAVLGNNVKVFLNDKHINIPSFENYVDMFYRVNANITETDKADGDSEGGIVGDDESNFMDNDDEDVPKLKKLSKPKTKGLGINKIYTETPDGRWKVCVVYDSNSGYRQISYVNSICTSKGGTHVNHVVEMIVSDLAKEISAKNKDVTIRNSYIKENLTFFIDCVIEDPDFDSQTKETMTSRVSEFGSRFNYSPEFIKKILKTQLMKEVIAFSELKEASVFKISDTGKKSTLNDLTKLIDSKKRTSDTRLILTEGDSAKTFAVSGLKEIGNELYGIFPLKGKMINVRSASAKKVYSNEEILNVMRILGLHPKKNKGITDVKGLRYGGIIILTDQDTDGFHIKGLIINFIHFFWPGLMAKVDGFIQTMSTPILKAYLKTDYKMKNAISFMTTKEYLDWTKTVSKLSDYKIKYYKGLGTSTSTEARESFENFSDKIITMVYDTAANKTRDPIINCNMNMSNAKTKLVKNASNSSIGSNDSNLSEESFDEMMDDPNNPTNAAINLGFNKKKAPERKSWLDVYDENDIIENDVRRITYCQFIHKGLKHFSAADNVRSIPSICDGLKPTNRKILDTTIRKKLTRKTIKVIQLSGAVMELTNYHHGDASLHSTTIGMAQRFLGSNNISLLYPGGGFGSRLQGGKDHASPRYIETRLDDLTPLIMREEDNIILVRGIDDGIRIEPNVFIPIIPMILVNGSAGIGTGFSTFIPSFNPLDVINNIKLMIGGKAPREILPWYRGFKGAVQKIDNVTYKTYGNYEEINVNSIRITELPIGIWTDNYKEFLHSLTPDGVTATQKSQKPKVGAKGKAKAPAAPIKAKKAVEPIIKNFVITPSDTSIDILITFMDGVYQSLIQNETLEKKLKLSNTVSINNMHLWDAKGQKIKKYKKIEDIFTEFYKFRLESYELRKQRQSLILENDMNIAKYKIKFLKDYMTKRIIIDKKQRKQVLEQLEKLKYPKLSKKISFESEAEQLLVAEEAVNDIAGADEPEEAVAGSVEDEEGNKGQLGDYDKSYSYITNLPLFSLTEEKLAKLEKEFEEKTVEYESYIKTPIKTIWLKELDVLQSAYVKWLAEVDEEENGIKKPKGKAGLATAAKKRVVRK
jgi:DNA topoisomerase-2